MHGRGRRLRLNHRQLMQIRLHLPLPRNRPMTTPRLLSLSLGLAVAVSLAGSRLAHAGEPEASTTEPATTQASGEAAVSLGGDAEAPSEPTEGASIESEGEIEGPAPRKGVDSREMKRKDVPWIRRWAPERNMGEIGVFGGVLLPALNHDFYNPQSGHKPLWTVAGDVGLRGAFFPLPYLGVELEGAAMPAKVRTSTNDPVLLWSARGHVILQLPFWSVSPFLLGGGGAMGVASNPVLLGSDVDPAAYWGGGVKVYINRWIGLRVEARHLLGAREATQRSSISHAEVLAGLIITLGRAKPKAAPPPNPDRDGDGFLNERDRCADTPGVSPDGCPPRDSDEDGFIDTEDACPYEKGVEPDGCPIRDQDGDGIVDERDRCIDRPETDNGFEDEDGCPDELPAEIREFSGVIEGIAFEYDKADVTAESKPVLDRAIKVLQDYPDIRIEIVGHTDNEGGEDYNRDLSQRRANAVRDYFVAGGIDESRLSTRGAGQSEPIASNDTEEGRAQNRRTEFKIIKRKRAD